MDISIQEISIHNYRSITQMNIKLNETNFYAICGANNVGKTNFLRALKLFFTGTEAEYEPEIDIPFHIAYGSRGQGYKSEIEVTFKADKTIYKIKKIFSHNKDEGNTLRWEGSKKESKRNSATISLTDQEMKEFLEENFQFFYLEASNVDLPSIISTIVKDEILPIGLKRKNTVQNQSMEALKSFISHTKEAVSKIENDITLNMKSFVNDIEGIDSSLWSMKIIFPEFNGLREAISGMINFTLYDTNNNALETKGSGIQRLIVLALIKYISEKSSKKIIWGIDEPEAFLQPSLQKQIKEELLSMMKDNYMFITTHSHFLIDISKPEQVFLFIVNTELKDYKRAKGKKFYKKSTEIFNKEGYSKVEAIKKHLGLEKNDSWEIMPYNIIVEGDCDQKYLLAISKKLGIEMPNFLSAGGASKVQGSIGYINLFCEELDYKPQVLCLFDYDAEGKKEYISLNRLINKNKFSEFNVKCEYIVRADNKQGNDYTYEVEDFIYPDLLYKSINKILRRKKYKIIPKKLLEMRPQEAYNRTKILDFLNMMCKLANPDKPALDFNEVAMKKYICKIYCDCLDDTDISEEDNTYPIVRQFLQKISVVSDDNT